jgi:hypothetical protein
MGIDVSAERPLLFNALLGATTGYLSCTEYCVPYPLPLTHAAGTCLQVSEDSGVWSPGRCADKTPLFHLSPETGSHPRTSTRKDGGAALRWPSQKAPCILSCTLHPVRHPNAMRSRNGDALIGAQAGGYLRAQAKVILFVPKTGDGRARACLNGGTSSPRSRLLKARHDLAFTLRSSPEASPFSQSFFPSSNCFPPLQINSISGATPVLLSRVSAKHGFPSQGQ